MTIAILGQACIDEIINASGEVRSQSLGGILYSYVALERMARDSHMAIDILPLGFHSRPDEPILSPFLSQLDHFDFKLLKPTEQLTNRVQLVYHTDSDRTEHCPTILPTLTPEMLERRWFVGIDALFVNMISGFDLTLEAMELLAGWSDTLGFHIHLDVHALSLGPLSQGEGSFGGGRKAQRLEHWREWLACAHTIQLNELEADHIAEPEFAGHDRLIPELLRMASAGNLPRLQAIVLTRAASGATLYDIRKRTEEHLSAPLVEVVDSTGSGDVFGASFIYELVTGASKKEATERSIRMATWNTQLRTIDEILTKEA